MVLGHHPSSSDRLQIDLGYEIHQGQFNSTGQFYKFSNIRYAAPPIGKLRFAPSTAPSTRHKVFNDGFDFAVCPNAMPAWSSVAKQWLMEGIGSINITAGYTIPNITTAPSAMPGTNEDCLFLDVLVPKAVFDDDRNRKGKAWGYLFSVLPAARRRYLLRILRRTHTSRQERHTSSSQSNSRISSWVGIRTVTVMAFLLLTAMIGRRPLGGEW
ncbi:hypothetical protein DL95DRAFT_463617 [Leptodontidium sp. 2 PMI_412]|nr:hypothetical protein DL95DRAFT_463617 [Leptodontidium sp. 2 PMI_412]